MTRSITIVNNSNWDHEDFIIHAKPDNKDEYNRLNYLDGKKIAPGEKLTFTPVKGYTISFEEVEEKKPEPFTVPTIDGWRKTKKQVVPVVSVDFK